MNKKEKELFWELCKFRNGDPKKRKAGLQAGAATPGVLGELFLNRMAGAAYGVLRDTEEFQLLNREFRNSLKDAYWVNRQKNESFFQGLRLLNSVLSGCRGKYAMLKGAYLCQTYPAGYRTSNDVDLLVEGRNVTEVGYALARAGFLQGSVRKETFVPAIRRDIVVSKMMRGETVPYIKEVNFPQMKYLEVDINFSLDYKNGDETLVADLIRNAETVCPGEVAVTTLNRLDFFIHLCQHLYKEATTYPWIQMKRDMTLYKFCDIYLLSYDWTEQDAAALAARIRELGSEKACYFAVYASACLFGLRSNPIQLLLSRIAPENLSFLHEVAVPGENTPWLYPEKDIVKRFWCRNRAETLEVKKP